MSFWRNYYHITWATKNRLPLILPDFEARLYAYMVKKAAEAGAFVYEINGMQEHVHLVTAIPPRESVAGVVKLVKGASAHYVNHVIRPDLHFVWQRGYGCLTVGEKQRHIAENYVRDQKQHHAEHSINGWLERYAEEDEGPADATGQTDIDEKFVRDAPGTYEALGEFPF